MNWWLFLESSVLNARILKEKACRGVNIECVAPIIDVYLARAIDPPEAQNGRLQQVREALFPSAAKRLTLSGYVSACPLMAPWPTTGFPGRRNRWTRTSTS